MHYIIDNSEFWRIQNFVYSGLFRHFQAYPALSRQIHVYWGIVNVKAYSGLFKHIQDPLQLSYIHNVVMFQALAYLEPEAHWKPCETFTRLIQILSIVRAAYLSIIHPYSGQS